MMDRSKRSLDKIDDMVQHHQIPKNPLREKENAVFVAYADNVDEEVISIIRKVINNFDQKIKPCFWKDLTHLGNTFDLIWEKINSCCLGICYFAERVGGIKHSDQGKGIDLRKFRYNPNVLVEAGMMQAISVIEKSKKEGTKPFKWLPIRESSMENIHYLYQQKAVIIERDKSGKISNPEDIYSIIKKHIEDYIQEYGI